MLVKLEVKNFAIIEDLTVDFQEGMNVLTGETGAGKSLLIDSLELICGARADKEMIRDGKDFSSVRALFLIDNDIEELKPYQNNKNYFEIYREIRSNSKNIIKINNQNISLLELKFISSKLIDIHTQTDLFKLLNPETYLSFIDNNGDEKFSELLNDYLIKYNKYKEEYTKYQKLLKEKDLNKDKLDLLEYELNELKEYNLNYEVDSTLEEEIIKLKNADKIYNTLNICYNSLNEEGISKIYELTKELSNIKNYSDSYLDYYEKVNNIYYELDDLKSLFYDELASFNFDKNYYDEIVNRHNSLLNLCQKYKKDLKELCSYYDSLSYEILKITDYDSLVKSSQKNVFNLGKEAYDSAILLRKYRIDEAISIEKQLINECYDLELKDVNFKIKFNEINEYSLDFIDFTDNGIDSVDFLVSFNKGEKALSLYKVASGGELSRLMLAFKTIFSKKNKLSLIVFDEIDTGVSGEASIMIARKMKEISKNQQVLCITHLLSVACYGDYNYYIYKVLENDRTYTKIKMLEGEEKVITLSKIISGNVINNFAIEHTRNLIEESKNY